MAVDPAVWVRQNADVRESALQSVAEPGVAFPDQVLTNPAVLVDIVKAMIIEAVRRDAPAGVIEGLLPPLREMAAGAKQLGRYSYIRTVMAEMRGLRDMSEIGPRLENAIAAAPDGESRAKLQDMLAAGSRAASNSNLSILGPNDATDPFPPTPPPGCLTCCVVGCVACTVECPLCCVAACMLCGVIF